MSPYIPTTRNIGASPESTARVIIPSEAILKEIGSHSVGAMYTGFDDATASTANTMPMQSEEFIEGLVGAGLVPETSDTTKNYLLKNAEVHLCETIRGIEQWQQGREDALNRFYSPEDELRIAAKDCLPVRIKQSTVATKGLQQAIHMVRLAHIRDIQNHWKPRATEAHKTFSGLTLEGNEFALDITQQFGHANRPGKGIISVWQPNAQA